MEKKRGERKEEGRKDEKGRDEVKKEKEMKESGEREEQDKKRKNNKRGEERRGYSITYIPSFLSSCYTNSEELTALFSTFPLSLDSCTYSFVCTITFDF